jgi:hypothetical protein
LLSPLGFDVECLVPGFGSGVTVTRTSTGSGVAITVTTGSGLSVTRMNCVGALGASLGDATA